MAGMATLRQPNRSSSVERTMLLNRQLCSPDRSSVAAAIQAIMKETEGEVAVLNLMKAFAQPNQLEWNRNAISRVLLSKLLCPQLLQLLVQCLDSCDGGLRSAASQVLLTAVSLSDGARPVDMIARKLASERMSTRKQAALLLFQLTERHESLSFAALQAAATFLEHQRDYVRDTALQCIVALANSAEDKQLIGEVTSRLEHADVEVRISAHKTMIALTEHLDDRRAWITAASRCLDSIHEDVRAAGVDALQSLSQADAASTIKLPAPLILPGPAVLPTAVDIPRVQAQTEGGTAHNDRESAVLRNSRAAIACVGDRLESSLIEIRSHATDALQQMGRSGVHRREDVLSAAAWRLHHEEEAIRETAVQAVFVLAEDGETEAVAAVMEYLDRGSSETRTTALTALGRIAKKGEAPVLAALSRQLQDADYRVVRQALLVVEQLARFSA